MYCHYYICKRQQNKIQNSNSASIDNFSKNYPCPRFLIKTAGYRRLIEKPSVKIGFSFYTLVFTDFSAISVWNLMKMFVFIKRIGL